MKDLRLDYLVMRGIALETNDEIIHKNSGIISKVVNGRQVMENVSCFESDWYVESFAPRKNNGSQPVPDDFPVILVFRDCSIDCSFGGRFIWEITDEPDDIMEWKPDIDKLIKQQAQYDFEQGKALSPQVEAGIEQIAQQLRGNEMSNYTQEMKDSGEVPTSGMKCKVKNVWLFVGVKSNGSWVMERESDKDLHSFHPREVKPYKSQEEIEFDAKKNELITAVSDVIISCADDNTFDIARAIYEAGYLRELTLTTKER